MINDQFQRKTPDRLKGLNVAPRPSARDLAYSSAVEAQQAAPVATTWRYHLGGSHPRGET